jgi:hypothetical protein
MFHPKRILFVQDIKDYTDKFLISGVRKQAKGLIRLGHDVQMFNYGGAFWETAPVASKLLRRRWCKHKVDALLARQIGHYRPDIIHVGFANFLDTDTVAVMRQAAPDAVLVGMDGDPWPELHPGRVAVASKLDWLLATYEGRWLDFYRNTGVRCAFMPNPCDPDIDRRYEVEDKWKKDILFTGKTRQSHKRYPTDPARHRIIERLAQMDNCAIYGCLGRPKIGGADYMYAISGAKMALSISIASDVRFYHSDRFTHYIAGGTLVLAKRVPDSDLLFKDGVHVRYFDAEEEFFELAKWYLTHEDERRRIADAGMARAHAEFSGLQIAKYTLDLIEKGSYDAPWFQG